jgi:hypothetical protein
VNHRRNDLRHYHALTVDEISALMVRANVDEANARYIVVRLTNGYFQRVSPLHIAPLHSVLFFPNGCNRWHDNIPLNGFQWDSSGFIQDDKNAIGGNTVPCASPCFNFMRTCYNITSTKNGFCKPKGFCSNSLLTRMHVLNKTT